ncbi:RNA polymerase sigma factor [Sphingopyxis sp. USTB-05]|uniref:RNA polymerase sigma factor n=1 Tax=Sphingopyxis sp. USTB-05 TaxID=2830667 RepID=UPI0020785624|nr:sigma-70 family RNA polymerase sigma factor [Sphingopyxis sp. USTB-05]USI78249.1 sigma-70 family RNA polymerase sigma factor [Sphingopyxis sp. USTB-05]
MAGATDADIIAAAAAGDRDAFEALLRDHYDRIHGLAWQLTGSRADADDIAQDVCCILAEKLSAFRGDAKFTTWLCSIVYNACRDFHRRRSAFTRFAGRLSIMTGLARGPDGRDLYDAIWIESAIARLKPDLRDTAILIAGQQLSHAEAAQILGVAEATISWRMHEIRRQIAPKADPDD